MVTSIIIKNNLIFHFQTLETVFDHISNTSVEVFQKYSTVILQFPSKPPTNKSPVWGNFIFFFYLTVGKAQQNKLPKKIVLVHLEFLRTAGKSPLCLSTEENVKRVAVSRRGIFTTSLVSQSTKVNK